MSRLSRLWDGGHWTSQSLKGLGPQRKLSLCNIDEVGEMTENRTPCPWRLERQNDYSPLTVVSTKHVDVADCTDQSGSQETDEANAEFITRACNAHDDLVSALKHCLREHGGFHIAGESERLARAALTKSEGH